MQALIQNVRLRLAPERDVFGMLGRRRFAHREEIERRAEARMLEQGVLEPRIRIQQVEHPRRTLERRVELRQEPTQHLDRERVVQVGVGVAIERVEVRRVGRGIQAGSRSTPAFAAA